MPAIALPVKLPGKTVQIAYVPSANPDWQDILLLQDSGQTYHVWYRKDLGWQGPELVAESA